MKSKKDADCGKNTEKAKIVKSTIIIKKARNTVQLGEKKIKLQNIVDQIPKDFGT